MERQKPVNQMTQSQNWKEKHDETRKGKNTSRSCNRGNLIGDCFRIDGNDDGDKWIDTDLSHWCYCLSNR